MKRILFISLLLASTALAGCASNSTPAPGASSGTGTSVPGEYAGKTNPLAEAGAAAGAPIFQSNCVACHGTDGHGDGPAAAALDPAPANLADLGKTAADDYLFWRISEGRPNTAMPAWKGVLTEEQIWQVISHIRTLK